MGTRHDCVGSGVSEIDIKVGLAVVVKYIFMIVEVALGALVLVPEIADITDVLAVIKGCLFGVTGITKTALGVAVFII